MSEHHAPSIDRSDPTRYAASRRVTWVSIIANLALTIAQVVIGVIGQSQALVADGIHTLSDLITDGMVLFALKHSAKAADDEHPYGHGRIETAVTMILGAMLIAVGVGIAVRAGWRLLDPDPFAIPSALTLVVALFTLAAKEGLFRYTMRTARRYDSAMLRANAWHHRSDAVSSLIVVAGIGGALYGYGYLDAVAAILVSALIVKIGGELAWQALRELIDTGLDPEEREKIRQSIQSVDGVKALHSLRTRQVGGQALVDVHVLVNPRISVSEGHQIGEVVRLRLIREIAPVADVMVHIDTDEDAEGESALLPLREEVLTRLRHCFREIPQAQCLDRVTLHYVDGRVDIELKLPQEAASWSEARALAGRLQSAVEGDPYIGRLEVSYQ